MAQEISKTRAFLNAALALAVLAAAGFGASRVAVRHWQWQKTFAARVAFSNVGGLELGGMVRVQGMDAGVVEAIVPPKQPGGPVIVVLKIDEKLRNLVRSDASARVAALGLVGGKVVEIVPGKPDAAPLGDGGILRAETPLEIADLMRDASLTMRRIDAVAQAAEKGLGEINAIAAEIRQGKGTLGKLVKDDDAYNQLMAMSTRGQKAIADLDDNLNAIKQTWPVSRYFNRRGFEDRDRVLYRPDAQRESRALSGDDLFERDRAVLTVGGRRQLDEFAKWFLKLNRPKTTDVVIAAFTDDAKGDEELAQALTQEQAESVRKYLIRQHAIDSVGWFGSRKVAAVGFGSHAPRASAENDAGHALPSRRVEIIVFTPQT